MINNNILVIELYELFYNSCKADINAANNIRNNSYDYLAIYHYQQAFEKGLKALHILKNKQIHENNYSDDNAYQEILRLSNNVEDSVLNLMTEIGEYERQQLTNTNITKNHHDNVITQLNDAIEGYIDSLTNLRTTLDLDNNLNYNINNYNDFVYRFYSNDIRNREILERSNGYTFLSFISITSCIYPCLYRMDTIARYPDVNFQYRNLDILSNQKKACNKLHKMLDEFKSLTYTLFTLPI